MPQHFTWLYWLASFTSFTMMLAGPLTSSALADIGDPVTTKIAFEDVRFELGTAITNRGLLTQSEGNLGRMLDRTGADVGSSKPIYKHAEFIEVCSAKYARLMFEADPTLIGNCPFIFYAYERIDRPGDVIVGFRRLEPGHTALGQKAVAETEAMLDAVVRASVK
jgi:uncharacterized protein (DUF302 family)